MGQVALGRRAAPLPSLTNPAGADKILNGYQAIDKDGNLITGTSPAKVLPSLANPAGAAQILSGYQAISGDGGLITGVSPAKVLPTLSSPAGADKILSGYQAVDANGNLITGTSPAKVLPALSNPAGADDIRRGKQAVSATGTSITGTLDAWSFGTKVFERGCGTATNLDLSSYTKLLLFCVCSAVGTAERDSYINDVKVGTGGSCSTDLQVLIVTISGGTAIFQRPDGAMFTSCSANRVELSTNGYITAYGYTAE